VAGQKSKIFLAILIFSEPIIGESAKFTARPFSPVLANLLGFDYRCNCAALVAALASRVFCPNALGALFLPSQHPG
jgi:hypothetical protein